MRTTLHGGLAALAILSACSKLPGVGKLGGGGSSGGGGAPPSKPVPAVTATPAVDDEAPYELRALASRARTLEGYAETHDDHQMSKQIPEVEDALAAARAKFPDRDYAPYERLLADAAAAIATIQQNRRLGEDKVKRTMAAREALDNVITETNGTLTPEQAAAKVARYQAMATRCRDEQLAELDDDIAAKCKLAAGPYPFAVASADKALAAIDAQFASMEQSKIPQAAKGEVWFDNDDTGFLDLAAWTAAQLAALEPLAAAGVTLDVEPRRTRAGELAAAFEQALITGGKQDALPSGLITSASITASATRWVDADGKVLRAGVEKSTVRPVKNDFGVVTGKSGAGYAVYQPPGKAYCFLRSFEAFAEASGKNWQLSSSGKVRMLHVTRCK